MPKKQQKPGRPGPHAQKKPVKGAPATSKAAVELSAANEAKIRSFLQELSAAGTSSAGQGPSQPTNSKQLQQVYMQTYEKLLEYGFKSEQVQQALTALPLGSADQDAALNWLCLHLPAAELPQRFAGRNRAAAGGGAGRSVKVRVLASLFGLYTWLTMRPSVTA
jgi:hypothetical protein